MSGLVVLRADSAHYGADVTAAARRHNTCFSLAAGTPVHTVAAMLGHADPSVTLRTYAHVLAGHADAAGSALTASIVGL